jgi:hypothetical protein
MCPAIRAVVICVVVLITLFGAIGSVRAAKRHSVGAQMLASVMLLALGFALPIVHPPQQGIEEATHLRRELTHARGCVIHQAWQR